MDRRQFLAVVGGAGLSGCLRLRGGGTQSTRSSPTGAPVDSQDATRTGTPANSVTDAGTQAAGRTTPPYPTGLSADGPVAYLVDTHQRQLTQTTFTTRFTEINVSENTVKQHRTYDVGTGVALGSWTFDHGGPVTMFRSNEGGFWREDLGGRYTYGEGRHGFGIGHVTWENWLQPTITAGEWGEPMVTQENPTVWTTETTGFADSANVPGYWHGTLRSLTASMQVDEAGIIRSLKTEFEVDQPGVGEKTIKVEYEVSSLGGVSVTEPEWLATAKDRRPVATAALTDDRTAVRFTLESGNRLEPDTNFTVYDERERWNAITYRLTDPITAGETVYFYKEQDGPFHGQLSRGSPPDGADPVPLDSEYHLWASRSVEYFGTLDL